MGLKAKCGFAMAFFAVAIPSDEFVMNGGKDECEFAIAPFPLELLSNDWFPIPTGGLSGTDRQTLIGLGCSSIRMSKSADDENRDECS